MDTQSFTTSILVDQSPSIVFKAINNPREWWSEQIEGTTDQLNAEWNYRFGDNHRSKMKVIEMIPDQKVVWLVEENYFKNGKDQSEWVGNKITFDISKQGDKTRLVFTQIGLVPAYDCYKVCDWAWTGFIQKSLHSLITTGKGDLLWFEEKDTLKNKDFTTSIEVEKSTEIVFNCITEVTQWWSKDFEGNSKKLNDEFIINHPGQHYSKQKLVEVIPGKKIVWQVTESSLPWIKDQLEWTNTKMIFDISSSNGKTILQFTHEGLVPGKECYSMCEKGWSIIINNWLLHFITFETASPEMLKAAEIRSKMLEEIGR